MSYNLFIDDERFPPDNGKAWTVARSSEEAIHAVKMFGVPSFISFDHDLGGEDTSIVFIDWFIGQYLDGAITTFTQDYYVHSQNPIGRENIWARMDGFIKFIQEA